MPKLKVQTWVDVYSMFIDIFGLTHEQAICDLPLEDILQIAYNKQAYEGWYSYAVRKAQEK